MGVHDLDDVTGSRDWVEHAACRGMDPNLFFERTLPLGRPKVKGARPFVRLGEVPVAIADVCGHCPVREDCLEYALANADHRWATMGIWGGKTPSERRFILAQRERRHA